MLHLAQLIKYMPFEYRNTNRQEIFNELIVYQFYHNILIVLREDIGAEVQYYNGWFIIVICLVGVVVNLGINMGGTAKDIYNKVHRWIKRRQSRSERAEKKEDLTALLALQNPDSADHRKTQIEINLLELRDKISEWHDTRTSLLSQGAEIHELKEEIEFQQALSKLKKSL